MAECGVGLLLPAASARGLRIPAVQDPTCDFARALRTSSGGEGGFGSPEPAPPPPAAAPRVPSYPPARGRSAASEQPGSGARNSAAGSQPLRSPRAPWRGGASALPGRRGRTRRPGAGLGAGTRSEGGLRARAGTGRGQSCGGGATIWRQVRAGRAASPLWRRPVTPSAR